MALPGELTSQTTQHVAAHSSPIDANAFFGLVAGAAGDQSALMNTAIAAAAGKTLRLHEGIYLVHNLSSPVEGTKIMGEGGGQTILKKNANGPVLTVNDHKVELHGIAIDGALGAYTGVGIEVQNANWFKFLNGRIEDTASYCVDYTANNTAQRSLLGDSVMRTWPYTTIPAVRYPPSETNGDRFLRNIDCNGGWLADFAGCATVMVSGCDTTGVIFGVNSKKVHLNGNRLATGGVDTVFKGFQHSVAGNIFAGGMHLTTLVGSSIGINVVTDSSVLTIDADCRANSVIYQGLGVTLVDNSTPGYNQVRINPGAATGAYTVTNPTTDRALNVTGDTLAQVAQVLGTLIADLKADGTLR